MKSRRFTAALVVAAALGGCSNDAAGPATGESANVTDPAGDAFGTDTVRWDLTDMTIARDSGGITVLLEFSHNLISPTSGDPNAMVGFVDFDVDQDATTGTQTLVDAFRPTPGLTGMGMEFVLALTFYEADSTVTMFGPQGPIGQVKPVFDGRQVSIQIPSALLGNDDGFLNAAAIVGTFGSPSDIIPDRGHLRLGGANSGRVQSPRSGMAAGRVSPAVTDGLSWVQH